MTTLRIRRMYTVGLVAVALLCTGGSVAVLAEIPNYNDVVPLDSPAYRLLDALYLDAGLALPSRSLPFSRHEFARSLERLERALAGGRTLSPVGDAALAELERLLTRRAIYTEPATRDEADDGGNAGTGRDAGTGARAGLYAAIEPATTLELRGHAPLTQTPAVGQPGSPGYLREHGYEERFALVHLPLEAWMLGSLYATVEFDLKQEYRTVDGRYGPHAPSGGGLNPSNVIVNPLEADLRVPLRAFLATGGPHWMVQFGRERVSWGPGRTGNFMLSDYNDYMEALRFSTWWNAFKFASLYAVSDSRETGSGTTDPSRYLAVGAHRLEFRIADVVQLAFSEAMTFGETYPELIRELNPIMIFHNWHLSTSRVSSMLSVEADATPLPGLNLWGEFAMNEFETPAEVAAADGGVANGVTAIAHMLGAEYQRGAGPGFARGGYEWALTYPWFPHHQNAPFLYQTVYWSFLDPPQLGAIAKPVGYFTGPDAYVHAGWAGYEVPGLFTAELRVQHRAKGEIDLTDPYPAPPTSEMRDDTTPTGTPEYRTVGKLAGEFVGLQRWTMGGALYLVDTRNEHHVPGANRLDVEWSVHAGFRW